MENPMNTWDIDEAVCRFRKMPNLGQATRFLAAFRDEVDTHSDGWAYWPKPRRAAKKLMALIQHKTDILWRGDISDATAAEFKATLPPIKAFYTRHGNAAGMKFPSIICRA
jgi:hypothetical protein